MNKNIFLKKKKKSRRLYSAGCVGMWFRIHYVKMFVGAVGKERGVKAK